MRTRTPSWDGCHRRCHHCGVLRGDPRTWRPVRHFCWALRLEVRSVGPRAAAGPEVTDGGMKCEKYSWNGGGGGGEIGLLTF